MSELAGLDQVYRGDPDRMQPPIQLSFPEFQKLAQHRVFRGNIQVLPNIGLEDFGMIGQAIKDLGGGQAVVLQLLGKAHLVRLRNSS